ncbi:MAG: WbqC family protein [Bacteroidia bacterium]
MILVSIGSIAYWSRLVNLENPIIHLNHSFQKQSELSQYDIVTSQGRLKLSIPTQKRTRKGPYENVMIDYNSAWQIEHWRSITNSYRKSPFFLYYGYKIEAVYMTEYKTLMQFNRALLDVLYNCLKLDNEPTIDHISDAFFVKTPMLNNTVYPQVFDSMLDFEENLSVLDLIFNLGPEATDYLVSL